MELNGTVALVTGANRGLGRHFAQQLLERGATKVYAAARNPDTIDLPGVVPIELDITDPESVARAAAVATDVDVLINNAGISLHQNLVTGDLDAIRRELETNFFGTLNVIRAFVPVRAILNVNSRLSWLSYVGAGGYAASKAAEWSLTNSVRLELPDTLVTGLYLSSTDTDMMAGWDIPKNDPADVVRQALDGLEADAVEVIADADTAETKAALSTEPVAVP
ncbi:SDR family oxidoreductase [Solirubrobacter phytolaccae]|uniref:SDR family oxidoreductase n=1 Tax=Solirubrobacter phytolaccae TaxID=1404360 RepID=A0A9X3N6Y4_9ACTN|nr:SDR family oxidoreductase [Solirubrobacter phytolaccae]MDA0179439.1 SDR family oxidoreductase [Solirubrobacter phytolaccae]